MILSLSSRTVRNRAIITACAAALLIIGAAVVLIVRSHSVFADVSGAYTYTIADGKATITAYDEVVGGLTPSIPSTLGGAPVDAIVSGAFNGKGLTAVTIPNSVTSIDSDSFSGNTLTSLTIGTTDYTGPAELTIQPGTFYSLGLSSVTIGNSVKAIENGAFSDNQLTSVTIPDSVQTIGFSVFYNNPLTSLTIGSSSYNGTPHLAIPNGAFGFSGGQQLTSLTLGNSVASIGTSAFYGNAITSLSIPGSVTTIGDSAFTMNAIASLELSEGTSHIGYSAFQNNQLTSVAIPNSVSFLGGDAFRNNPLVSASVGTTDYSGPAHLNLTSGTFPLSTLTSLTLGNSVASIGAGVFNGSLLTSVTIPDSVTSIGSGAFNMSQLSSVQFGQGLLNIGAGAFSANQLQSVVIPDSVTLIDSGAFSSNQISSLTLGSGLVTLNGGAFSSNQLTSVVIPASVTSLGIQAFHQNNLRKVVIEGTPTIGSEAFLENGLDRTTIPSGYVVGSDDYRNYYAQHASLVNVYSTDPNATYTDQAYQQGNFITSGYIINPAALTTVYRDALGNDLHAPVTQTAPAFANYLLSNTLDTSIPGSPTLDFAPYYRLGVAIAATPYDVDGFITPAATTITLTAQNTNDGTSSNVQTFLYATPQEETGASSPLPIIPGVPNTGLFTNTPSVVGFIVLVVIGATILSALGVRVLAKK